MISLEIEDEYELLALHNALMEAKVSEAPSKVEIVSSPYVARLANKVCDELENQYKPSRMDILRKRPPEYNAWKEWRSSPDMEKIESHTLRYRPDDWYYWSKDQKEDFLKILIAPYALTDSEISDLIEL